MSEAAATIEVRTGRPYRVHVGRDLFGLVEASVPPDAQRVAVIHPRALRATGEQVRADLAGSWQAVSIEVPDAEEAKTAEVLNYCWRVLGEAGFTRTDCIVGIGGGSTTDLAGFVAATWLRGVPVIQVPTTLLAMVDAAVGGKTGINTASGKNLVGAFHEPSAVLCDMTVLAELPRAEMVSGMAEVIKAGFIADPRILDIVAADPEAALTWDSEACAEVVRRAIAVKAEVVAGDFREDVHLAAIGREVLNYGHTLGHAIELVERYQWRHGAAVSVGMVYAAELSRLAGRLDDATVARHRELLGAVGLPTGYGGRFPALLDAMRRDKKTRGDTLRFIILAGVARPEILTGPDPALLLSAFDEVSS